MADPLPPKHILTVGVCLPYAEEVKKRTDGRVIITVYDSAILAKITAQYDMVRTGGVEMALILPAYHPGVFPLSDIVGLPFVCRDAMPLSRVVEQLRKDGWFDKEYADAEIKLLGHMAGTPYAFFSTDKKITTLEDMKGMKVRVSGGLEGAALEALGGVPVTVSYGELYLAMQTGVIDVATTSMSGGTGIKLEEITKYALDVGYSTVLLSVVSNKDVFQKLPEDIQKIMEEVGDLIPEWGGKAYEDAEEQSRETFRKAGAEVYELSPAEMGRWQMTVQPVWDEWVEDMEKKGLPAREMVKEFISLLEKGGVTLPF